MTETNTISTTKLYLIMIAMMVVGCLGTIVAKFQDEASSHGQKFTHPFFQTGCMFVAEFICLGIFQIMRWHSKRTGGELIKEENEAIAQGKRVHFNRLLFAIPASCDILTSTLMLFGLLLVSASVYQMLRGGIVIFTAIFSVIFLKRKLYRHHWIGVGLVMVGLILVSIASLFMANSNAKTKTSVIGIILLAMSFLTCSVQFIVEEKLFSSLYVHPVQAVGLEGIAGLSFYIFILLIFNNVQSDSLTTITVDGRRLFPDGVLEDTNFALMQVFTDWVIFWCVMGFMFTIAGYNSVGLAVTKYASATARAVLDVARTVVIWIVFLCIRWEDFIWLQLVGFIILTAGTLLYNEIVILKFWGLEKGTKKYLSQITKMEEDEGKLWGAKRNSSIPSIYLPNLYAEPRENLLKQNEDIFPTTKERELSETDIKA